MDADKSVPVLNIPPVMFIGGTINHIISGIIQGSWDPEILVSVITTVGVPVDEALSDIVMNARIEVIHLEYSCEEACIY